MEHHYRFGGFGKKIDETTLVQVDRSIIIEMRVGGLLLVEEWHTIIMVISRR